MKKLNKKAQPQVVATVLLILIVIIAVVIIMGFVIPFINERVSESDCLDVLGQVEIQNDQKYTCYDGGDDQVSVQIHVIDVEVDGFVIEVGGVNSNSYQVTADSPSPEVKMHDGTSIISIPGKNQARTYNITSITEKPDSISVYPILESGKTCETADTISSVDLCFNPF